MPKGLINLICLYFEDKIFVVKKTYEKTFLYLDSRKSNKIFFFFYILLSLSKNRVDQDFRSPIRFLVLLSLANLFFLELSQVRTLIHVDSNSQLIPLLSIME